MRSKGNHYGKNGDDFIGLPPASLGTVWVVVSSIVAPRSPIACLNRSGFVRVVVTTEYPVPHGLGGSCLGTTGTTGATGTLYCEPCTIGIHGLIACADTVKGVSSARVKSIGFMLFLSLFEVGL